MNLEPFIAITGESGLYSMVASRPNGLILESIETKKTKFYSVRKHQFTPLGTVAIYTLEGTTPLKEVMQSMLDKLSSKAPVSPKAEKHEIEEYFEFILPDYDEDKVPIKDMKKVIKWFTFLNERNLLNQSEEEE